DLLCLWLTFSLESLLISNNKASHDSTIATSQFKNMTGENSENLQETSVYVPNEAQEKSQIPRIISIPLIANPSYHKPYTERVGEGRRRRQGGIFDKIFSRPPRTKKTKKPKKPKVPSAESTTPPFLTDTEAPDSTTEPPPPPEPKTKSKPRSKRTRKPKPRTKQTRKPSSKHIPEPTPSGELTSLSPTEAPEISKEASEGVVTLMRTSLSSGKYPHISTALSVVTEKSPMNIVGPSKPAKSKKKSKQINFGSIVLIVCGAVIAFLLAMILVLLCRIRLVMIAEKKSEVELAMSNG
ncbi:hypothetical protein GCK32_007062, partial [Trichostrongylus colubriformis]